MPRFPPRGPRGRSFPRFYGTIKALRLPAALPAALRFLRLAVPREHSCFACSAWRSAPTPSLELVTRYLRPGLLPWRRQDLPSSWGAPIPVCSCSSTPAGRRVPDQNGTLAWPPLRERRRRRQEDFRGSLAWLPGSLPTYHVTVTRPTAQGSLPGAGQALLGGLGTRRAPINRFPTHFMFVILLFQASWHDPLFPTDLGRRLSPVGGNHGIVGEDVWAILGSQWINRKATVTPLFEE